MIRYRTIIPLVPAAVAALLSLPGVASAKDFCVGNPAGCSGTAAPATALESTIAATANDGAGDRVFVGAGTFDVKPIVYNGSDRLELIGAGAGTTRLRSSGDGAVVLLSGNPGTTVSRVTLDASGAATHGLRLLGTRAEDVEVATGGSKLSASVQLNGAATFTRGTVTTTSRFAPAVQIFAGNGIVSDSTVTAPGGAGIESRAPDASVQRVRVVATRGVSADGGHLTISDSLVDTRGEPNQVGVLASANTIKANTPSIDAVRLTVVGSIPTSDAGAGVVASAERAGNTATVRLRDSVVSGFRLPIARLGLQGAVAHLTTDRSAYANTQPNPFITGPGTLTENDRIDADPRLADPANGDFHLAADSPLIDAGTPGSVTGDVLDLDGKPRASDGNGDCSSVPDVGAFEFQGAAGSCGPVTTPGETPPVVVNPAPPVVNKPVVVGPKLSKVKVKAGKRRVATIKFKLSAPARVVLRFAKVSKRGKLVVLKTKVKVKGKAGGNARRVRLAPGTYRVTAVATAAGRTSAAVTKPFRVLKGRS